MVCKETCKDDKLQKLMTYIGNHNHVKKDETALKEFKDIFSELYVLDGLIMHGSQVTLPQSLQVNAIALAHKKYQFADKTPETPETVMLFSRYAILSPGIREDMSAMHLCQFTQSSSTT